MPFNMKFFKIRYVVLTNKRHGGIIFAQKHWSPLFVECTEFEVELSFLCWFVSYKITGDYRGNAFDAVTVQMQMQMPGKVRFKIGRESHIAYQRPLLPYLFLFLILTEYEHMVLNFWISEIARKRMQLCANNVILMVKSNTVYSFCCLQVPRPTFRGPN
jgi:hypothetical protein